MVLIRRQTQADVAHVVANMREADAREVFAHRFSDDREELTGDLISMMQFDSLRLAVAAEEGGEAIALLCMWQTGKPGVASAGMIATDEWPRVALGVTRWLLRIGFPKAIDPNFRRQECRVSEGHVTAQRWLNALGFITEGWHKCDGKGGETFLTFGRLARPVKQARNLAGLA